MNAKRFQQMLDILGAVKAGEDAEFRYYCLPNGTTLGFEHCETWAEIAEALLKESERKEQIQ